MEPKPDPTVGQGEEAQVPPLVSFSSCAQFCRVKRAS
jgi:hypothetical protein